LVRESVLAAAAAVAGILNADSNLGAFFLQVDSDGESGTTSWNSKRQKKEPASKNKARSRPSRSQNVKVVPSKRARQRQSPDPSPELGIVPEGLGTR